MAKTSTEEFRHGGLAIDLPSDWRDQSTLVFVAPPDNPGQIPTAAPVATPTEAIQLNLFLDTFGDARDLLRDQAKQLAEVDDQFEVLSEEPFECRLGKGWIMCQRLRLDDFVVRQLVAAVLVKGVALVASAVAADERFDRKKAQLTTILESIRGVGE